MIIKPLKIGNLEAKYPIIQGGMAYRISGGNLAAAVAEAGGIGLIAATGLTLSELQDEIRLARRKSKGIIGINIMFAVNGFKELVQGAIDEGVDLIVQGAGFSKDIFKWCKAGGVPFVPIVSTAKLAKISEGLGASAVVVEGKEAGGHLGTDVSMRVLVGEVKQVVGIPVIAAGGVVDAQDVREALLLGADGVQMGIRFAASLESGVADSVKDYYVRATHEDMVIIQSPVGLPGRALRNQFTDKITKGDLKPKTCNKCLKVCKMNFCIMAALINAWQGNIDDALIFSGEYIDKIKEILPAKVIIDNIMAELGEM